MWDKINYKTGVAILNNEIDDIDLALMLSSNTKEFKKNLLTASMPEIDINKLGELPKYFRLKKVPQDLTDIEFSKIIQCKTLLSDLETIDVVGLAGQMVSIVMGIDLKKVNKSRFLTVLNLGIFFLHLLKKL